jgi:hypothetical protein
VDAFAESLDDFERDRPFSRRRFLKAAAVAGAAGILGCSDDGTGPTTSASTPTPVIEGPTEATIPGVGRSIRVDLDSSASEGTIFQREWGRKLLGTEIEPERTLDNDVRQRYYAARPGEHNITFTATNNEGSATATHRITVHPPELPGGMYNDLPLLFAMHEEADSSVSGAKVGIWSYDLKERRQHRIVGSDKFLGNTLNWEPSGELILLSTYTSNAFGGGGKQLTTYNTVTGEFKNIYTRPPGADPTGLTWKGTVSPDGEWVAFLDDSRAENRGYDEGALVRIDGSGQRYLTGGTPTRLFSGLGLSWDPASQRIAIGCNNHDALPDVDGMHRRIAIVDDLWSETPRRTQYLPTEDQLYAHWEKVEEDVISWESFRDLVAPGIIGLAWSPDGTRLAYSFAFYTDSDQYSRIGVSNVDGTGDIDIVARGSSTGQPLTSAGTPTWDIDAHTLYITARSSSENGIYRVNPPNLPQVLIHGAIAPTMYD